MTKSETLVAIGLTAPASPSESSAMGSMTSPSVSCTGALSASSALCSILPYSMGYLRSSSQAAAVQYWVRDAAADLMVVSRHLLYWASAFFSSSYNARFTPVFAFSPSLSQR